MKLPPRANVGRPSIPAHSTKMNLNICHISLMVLSFFYKKKQQQQQKTNKKTGKVSHLILDNGKESKVVFIVFLIRLVSFTFINHQYLSETYFFFN